MKAKMTPQGVEYIIERHQQGLRLVADAPNGKVFAATGTHADVEWGTREELLARVKFLSEDGFMSCADADCDFCAE